jgi:hypothetical protein
MWRLEGYSLWVIKHILNITSAAIIEKFTAWVMALCVCELSIYFLIFLFIFGVT